MRVLHMISSFGRGGAPAVILNYMKYMPESIKFDFLLRSGKNAYMDEISDRGGKVFNTASFPKHIIKNWYETIQFICNHKEYKVIHVHCNSLVYVFPICIAKKLLNRKIIIHSHNTMADGKIAEIIHYVHRPLVKFFSNERIACSDIAGKWCYNNKDYVVLRNAIDLSKFQYDEKERNYVRKKLNIEDKHVFIHVGRFEKQKNHDFLINIFNNLHLADSKAVLLLIGTGSLQEEIINKVKKMDLSMYVFFLGEQENVQQFLTASDVMLFPSLWEGLPVTLVEAQGCGLKILCSDVISKEVHITSLIQSVPLNKSAEFWANEAEKLYSSTIEVDVNDQITKSGYNIMNEVINLKKIYEDLNSNV